jgi:biopolymer transport protein ExbD
MALGSLRDDQHEAPMAEINTTPLVDVMLVLFVIFLVTAPMLTHTVPLDLPEQALAAQPEQQRQTLAITAAGLFHWNDQQVSAERLQQHLRELAATDPESPVDLRVDKQVTFETVSSVMAWAQQGGLRHIGFVLETR